MMQPSGASLPNPRCRKCRITQARLGPRNVATIVKAAAAKLGLEAAAFAGHSQRAGFVTSAVKRGANLIKITDVTGHRSLEMLKTYSRDAETFAATGDSCARLTCFWN